VSELPSKGSKDDSAARFALGGSSVLSARGGPRLTMVFAELLSFVKESYKKPTHTSAPAPHLGGTDRTAVAAGPSPCCRLRLDSLPTPPSTAAPTPVTAAIAAPTPVTAVAAVAARAAPTPMFAAATPTPMASPLDRRDVIRRGRKVADSGAVDGCG
jgi:hypothetical protein